MVDNNPTLNVLKNGPLISVLIRMYYSADFLRESLGSILSQTYENIEVLLLDDTPDDDGSDHIIKSFHDPRVIYIKPENRLGIVKSLNYGIKVSKGDFICILDADDISHIRRLEIQVQYLLSHPEIGVLGSSAYEINEKGKIIGCIEHPLENNDIKCKMFFNAAIIHPSVIIRKSLFENGFGYNEDCYCCEDYELWSRLIHVTCFHNMREKLIMYRVSSNSAMHSQLRKIENDDDYYFKHTIVLKDIYDNVLKWFDVNGENLSTEYVDLIFAKRLSHFTLEERETFLKKCKNVLKNKINSKYVDDCIGYQWVKMSKRQFLFGHDKSIVLNSIKQILIRSKSLFTCKLFSYKNSKDYNYDWPL